MATICIEAKINFNGLLNACERVPDMLEMEPSFKLIGVLDGCEIYFNTIEDVMAMVREIIKREKATYDAAHPPLLPVKPTSGCRDD